MMRLGGVTPWARTEPRTACIAVELKNVRRVTCCPGHLNITYQRFTLAWPLEWLVDLLAGSFMRLQLKRSEEHTSELQSQSNLVCRLLLEKKKNTDTQSHRDSTSII